MANAKKVRARAHRAVTAALCGALAFNGVAASLAPVAAYADPFASDVEQVAPESAGVSVRQNTTRKKVRPNGSFVVSTTLEVPAEFTDGLKGAVVSSDCFKDVAGVRVDASKISVAKNGEAVQDATATAEGNAWSIDLGDLAAKDVVTVSWEVALDGTIQDQPIEPTAKVSYEGAEEAAATRSSVWVARADETFFDCSADATDALAGSDLTFCFDSFIASDVADVRYVIDQLPEGFSVKPDTVHITVNGSALEGFEATEAGITAAVGDLKAGDAVSITFGVKTADTVKTGTAAIACKMLAGEELADSGSASVNMVAKEAEENKANEISKVANVTDAEYKDDVAYTIEAVIADDTATAKISDKGLAEGMEIDLDSVKVTVNGEADADAKVVENDQANGLDIDLGSQKAGDKVKVTYEAAVASKELRGETVRNTATIETDDKEDTAVSTANVDIAEAGDTTIIKKVSAGEDGKDTEVSAGEKVGYAVVANIGDDLSGVVIEDAPKGATVDKDSVTVKVDGKEDKGARVAAANGGFKVDMGNMKEGSRVEVAYTATVDDDAKTDTQVTNTAKISSADLEGGSKSAAGTIDVAKAETGEFTMEMLVDPEGVKAGEQAHVRVLATPKDTCADNAQLSIAVPRDLKIIDEAANSPTATIAGEGDGKDMTIEVKDNVITASFPKISDGQSMAVDFAVEAPADAEKGTVYTIAAGADADHYKTATANAQLTVTEPADGAGANGGQGGGQSGSDANGGAGGGATTDASREDTGKDLGKSLGKTGDALAGGLGAVAVAVMGFFAAMAAKFIKSEE